MRNIKPEILLTTLGLIFSSVNVYASECTPAPDCASLGYNKTTSDCEGMATIKCPFDTSKILCMNQDSSVPCSIGKVLGNDQKCYDVNNLPSSVKPIGVVFDAFNQLAMALTDAKQDGSTGSEKMRWSSGSCDTPNLENCEDKNAAMTICGIDGRKNTDAILATNGGCGGTIYAANAANLYQPSNCAADFCQKGKWFLPSMRDFFAINTYMNELDKTLQYLSSQGATYMTGASYWLSTEISSYSAWTYNRPTGNFNESGKGGDYYVRPVIKF